MLEYANSVGENRTHLEVLDAHLYAKNMGKKLAIAIDSPTVSEGEFLKVMSSSEFSLFRKEVLQRQLSQG